MNLKPIKVAVQYVLGFSIAIGFVALLTFIFSFLGTIFCAALTGMMLGATRCRLWKSVLSSLVFPGVLFTMMYIAKSEIPFGRLVLLAGLCLVAFWLTYPGGRALISMEDKHRAAADAVRIELPEAGSPHRGNGAGHESVAAAGVLRLEDLQGSWACEAVEHTAAPRLKHMDIIQDKLTLEVRTAEGRVTFTATAEVHVSGREAALIVDAGSRDAAVGQFEEYRI